MADNEEPQINTTEPKVIETWCLACNNHMPGESPEVAFCDTCVNLSQGMDDEADEDEAKEEKKEFMH